MTDNELNYLTVSQCINSDWCRGYNEAVQEANEIINRQKAEIKKLKEDYECSEIFIIELEHELDFARSEIARIKKLNEDLNNKNIELFSSNKELKEKVDNLNNQVLHSEKMVKIEAIKEFANRLKKDSPSIADDFGMSYIISEMQIDNLLKEMESGNNG